LAPLGRDERARLIVARLAAIRMVGGAAFAMHAAPHRSAAIDRAVRHATREPRPSACMRPHALSAIIAGG
jgi:hypothetical protein